MSDLFTTNVAQLVPFPAYLLLPMPLPPTVMQALGVSIGTDLLPALALGAEPRSAAVMNKPPEPPLRPLLTWAVGCKRFPLFGSLEATLGLACFAGSFAAHGWHPFASLAPYHAWLQQAPNVPRRGRRAGGPVGRPAAQRDGALRNRLSLRANP